jgi:hypothetical protein
MYISDMTHFLDEQGNIAKGMHQEGREMAGFLALIIDQTTKDFEHPVHSSDIRCRIKKCDGKVEILIDANTEEIKWSCTHCDEDGKISGWQNTKWDNRS